VAAAVSWLVAQARQGKFDAGSEFFVDPTLFDNV
jgi:hypothetical protein